ncbi:MAG TPA: tetratricopeptide repeat protein [Terracidiphilus sp.]
MSHCYALLLVPALFHSLSGGTAAFAQEADEQLAAHQQRARAAEERQDFAAAVREYRALADALPNNAELESNLGVALYFNHEFKRAADTLRRAETLKPALYAPHLFAGLAMAQLGEPDAAVVELQKAVSINSADPLAHTWLGYEYTAQSRFERAAEQMQIAVQQKPEDQDVWFALGRCYLELGKQATIELLHAAPDGGRTWQLAGEQYEAQGNKGKAVKLYSGALERRPDLTELGEKVHAPGGTAAAAKASRDANHDEEDRLYRLVHSYQAKAKEAFERVARIDADSYRAHQVLGDSYAAADRFDDAIPEYRMVLERKPDLPGIHGALCNALSRTGRIREAIKECDAEIAVSPYSAGAYAQDARLHVLEDDHAQAATLLQKALTLDRPPIAVYKLQARIEVAQKRYPAAIKSLTHYLAGEPKDASAWFLLARAYKAAGNSTKMAEAIETYKKTSDAAKGSGEVQRAFHTQRDGDALPGEAEMNGASESSGSHTQ